MIKRDTWEHEERKLRGSQTIRHCRSMCGSNFSGLVACFVGLCQWQSRLRLALTTVTAPEVVPGDLRQCARREGLEVRLSREWVRAFLVSIDLSFQAAAQRRGLSTSVPRPNRCCKRSSATFLQPCDVGLMCPFKVDAIDDEQRTYRHAPSYLAVISTVSGCDLRNT